MFVGAYEKYEKITLHAQKQATVLMPNKVIFSPYKMYVIPFLRFANKAINYISQNFPVPCFDHSSCSHIVQRGRKTSKCSWKNLGFSKNLNLLCNIKPPYLNLLLENDMMSLCRGSIVRHLSDRLPFLCNSFNVILIFSKILIWEWTIMAMLFSFVLNIFIGIMLFKRWYTFPKNIENV